MHLGTKIDVSLVSDFFCHLLYLPLSFFSARKTGEILSRVSDAETVKNAKELIKYLMKKYNIPTARYEVFSAAADALGYIENCTYPIVIKADGLALGKGVIIAENKAAALDAVHSVMEDKIFGASGNSVVIEEFLTGPEVSVLCFTDGKTIKPMVSSMDHKRIGDGDVGPNTGGMGTIAPNPYYTDDIAAICMETIFKPTVNAMNAEGRTFKGCLYFGLMLTEKGPKVIEYNCRFGDPETQVVLPLLESDLFEIMEATTNGTLTEEMVKFSDKSACCVVMASNGYPQKYETGFELTIPTDIDGEVYVAGAKIEDGKLLTAGGRVLGAVAVDDTLKGAVDKAYNLVPEIKFENAYFRHDIGQRALAAKEEK